MASNRCATLKALQRRHDATVAARDPRAIDEANEAVHGAFCDACGNQVLAEAIAHYAYLSRAMRLYPMVDPPLLETLRGEHWAMIDALRSGDRAALTALVVDHIHPVGDIHNQGDGDQAERQYQKCVMTGIYQPKHGKSQKHTDCMWH